jgi:hypothetical protein
VADPFSDPPPGDAAPSRGCAGFGLAAAALGMLLVVLILVFGLLGYHA